LSPQTRRGRSVPASHRKPTPRATAPLAAEDADGLPAEESKPASTGGVRRRGAGVARMRKTSGARYLGGLFGAYTPLIVAFVILFAGVWVYRSFINPPPPQPQQLWTQIEDKYIAKIDAARLEINNPNSDFATRIQGFKDYSAALKSWMKDLAAVTDWTAGALPSASADYTMAASDIGEMVAQGNIETGLLDKAATATSEADIETYTTELAAANEEFESYWAAVASDMGLAAVDQPTLALPATPTPGPSGSAEASGSPASPVPSGSPAVGPSPSPSIALPSPSASPS